jgi:chloride channel protein, CIC family
MNRIQIVSASRRTELKDLASRSHQVVILAACAGAITGLFVAGFDRLVIDVGLEHVLQLRPWLIALMPGAGLLLALLARRTIDPTAGPGTADEYLHAFHDPAHHLTWRPFVARIVAALATLGSGNPMGLEGPSMYAGATLGDRLQHHFPKLFRTSDRKVLLVAGAAAGVAAIFKAPATGAVFAMEVPYQEDLARGMLLPALVASGTGYLTFAAINGTNALFPINGSSDFAMVDILGAIAVGIIAGLGARGFAKLLRTAKSIAARPHPALIAAAAGATIAGLYVAGRLLTGESLTVTSGYDVIAWASTPGRTIPILLAILVLRSLSTTASVAGGGVGGLFIPLVVAGALTGSIIGNFVDPKDLTMFIVIGVAAFLGAGYRVPLAAVMFVAETTGRPSFIVPGLFAAVAAELMMGTASVTRYQRRRNQPVPKPVH